MATIPANNNTGLYNTSGVPATTGNDLTVTGNVNANNVNAVNTVNAGTNITAGGNVTAAYFIGNGSQLTNINAGNIVNGYGNANVAAYLASGTNTSNVITTGNVSGTYILGNGSQLTGIASSYGNANVAAFLPTYTGNLAGGNAAITNNLVVGGIISGTFSGNITGNLVVPGSNTQIIFNNAGNAGASADFTFNDATNLLTVAGNVNATQFNGSGAGLTSLPGANVTGTVANATYATSAGVASSANSVAGANVTGTVALANAATFAGTVTTAAQPNITSVGNLTTLTVSGDALVSGNLTVNGNVTYINSNTVTINDKFINVANNAATSSAANGGGIGVGPVGAEYATWTFSDANTAWQSNIRVEAPSLFSTGNVTGSYFLGNGSQLTGLPATYGNANVASLLAAFGSNTISTSGNISGGNMISATFQAVNSAGSTLKNAAGTTQASWGAGGGDNFAISVSTNLNGNNAQVDISPTGTGHVHINPTGTGAVEIKPTSTGSINNMVIGNVTPAAATVTALTASGNISGGNAVITSNVVTGGIKTDGYYYANGTPVTFGGSSYGNANVANFLANFGSNTIVTTGNANVGHLGASTLYVTGGISGATQITGTNITAIANVGAANFNGGNAYVAYIESAGNIDGTNLNLSGSLFLAASNINISTGSFVGGNAQITSNITSGNLSVSGQITAGGNISGNYILGNGSALTGVVATSIGGNLSANLNTGPYYIQNPGGDVLMGNVWVTGLFAANSISSPAGDFVQIEGITVTNGLISSGNIQALNVFSNAAITAGTTISASGNIVSLANINGANINASGTMRSTGDVFITGQLHVDNIASDPGSYVVMDGVSAGLVYIQDRGNLLLFEAASSGTNYTGFRAPATLAGDYLYTLPTSFGTASQVLTTDGSGTLTWTSAAAGAGGSNTQIQFNDGGSLAGNAAIAFNKTNGNISLGNLIVNTQQIQTTANANVGLSSSLTPNPGRIFVGSGYNGNTSPAFDLSSGGRGGRLVVSDSINISDGNSIARGAVVQNYYTLTANVTSTNARLSGIINAINIGGGSAANTMSGSPFGITALTNQAIIGGGTSGNLTGLGNALAQYVTSTAAFTTVNTGSTGGNVYGTLSLVQNNGTSNAVIAYSSAVIGSGTYAGNVLAYLHPSNVNKFGQTTANAARNATNYYAFYNDDDVAQMKLGSVRLFHEFEYQLTSSGGAVTVDKNNGQVQFFTVSEAATLSVSNFVTSASTGSTTKYQADTVTVIVQQDATGRTITMPTPSATYKYAGGTSTVPATASSVSMISITAIYNAVTAATQYLITISPEFT